MSASVISDRAWPLRPARRAAAFRSELAGLLIATSVIALHVVDDNFLQSAPGTSASDHLASGLVPLALLVAVAAVYSRLRAGARDATAMTLGAVAITIGIPGAYYVLDARPLATITPGCSRSLPAPSSSQAAP